MKKWFSFLMLLIWCTNLFGTVNCSFYLPHHQNDFVANSIEKLNYHSETFIKGEFSLQCTEIIEEEAENNTTGFETTPYFLCGHQDFYHTHPLASLPILEELGYFHTLHSPLYLLFEDFRI